MLRITRFVPLLILLAFTAAPAQAAQGVKACIGPSSASALNQYCENIPTATGGSTPGAPGTSGLGTMLPAQVSRRIQATSAGDPRRKLLAIPTSGQPHLRAGNGRNSAAKVSTNLSGVKTDPVSIGLGLILVLVLSALALVTLAFERRRRSGTG
jgi:hypothetical protein